MLFVWCWLLGDLPILLSLSTLILSYHMLMFVILHRNDVMLCWFAFRLVWFNRSSTCDAFVDSWHWCGRVRRCTIWYCTKELGILRHGVVLFGIEDVFFIATYDIFSRVLCDKLLCAMLVRSSSSTCLTWVGLLCHLIPRNYFQWNVWLDIPFKERVYMLVVYVVEYAAI